MGTQPSKSMDCDGHCGEVLLDQSRQHIGLVRREQMTVVSVGGWKLRGIVHPGLILQGHGLHRLAFLRGDDFFREEPTNQGDFFPHMLIQVLCKNS